MKLSHLAKALLASSMLFTAVNANAADPITVTGSAALTSDYLFRGVSQTGNNAAVQAGMTSLMKVVLILVYGVQVLLLRRLVLMAVELDTLLGYSGKAGEVSL
jgi:hypothetical protein